MTALWIFLALSVGALIGMVLGAILSGTDEVPSRTQGPQTPPADPNDTEWQVI